MWYFLFSATMFVRAQTFDLTSTSSVRTYIEQQSSNEDIDPTLASAIARCESRYQPFATGTPERAGWRDIGPFQLNEHYQKAPAAAAGYDIYDPRQNILYGLILLKKGTAPWNASKDCWGIL